MTDADPGEEGCVALMYLNRDAQHAADHTDSGACAVSVAAFEALATYWLVHQAWERWHSTWRRSLVPNSVGALV